MTYPIISDNIVKQIDIRAATYNDIDGLIDLNKVWQRDFLGVNTMQGFLSGSFDADTFKRLIDDKT
ncbi:MAG: hypothetical protein H7068_09850, partial [Pedobacter sp.]|nr:hypothetical protein [Chitinophagaceae bacterium]